MVFINDEIELIQRINGLEQIAKNKLPMIKELHYEDLYFMSVIDKSLKLINAFLFALKERNVTVLATLTRVQMDCSLRTFATTLVNDSSEFCERVLVKNEQINKIKDRSGKSLTDKHLCEKLGEHLDMDVYGLYRKVCGFVHFSSDSFRILAKTEEKNSFSMLIGRNNRKEDEKEFERLSLEMANDFYFFGNLLIDYFFTLWLKQIGANNEVI